MSSYLETDINYDDAIKFYDEEQQRLKLLMEKMNLQKQNKNVVRDPNCESCKFNGYYSCTIAASNGHLDCLKYAHENGCSWNAYTCKIASRNGYLNCLKYAHENGCEWNKHTYKAALYRHQDCLKYAIENGCPKA